MAVSVFEDLSFLLCFCSVFCLIFFFVSLHPRTLEPNFRNRDVCQLDKCLTTKVKKQLVIENSWNGPSESML